jgi:hypothetical protein
MIVATACPHTGGGGYLRARVARGWWKIKKMRDALPIGDPLDAGERELAVARIGGDAAVHSEECMEPKRLYGAAAATKTNASTEDASSEWVRAEIWRGLGLTPEELGERLRLALDTAVKHLEATETKFFSHEGVVTDERTVAYHKAQLKAVHEIHRLTKMLAKEKPRPVSVHVQVTNT